jgi:hypothetical protein
VGDAPPRPPVLRVLTPGATPEETAAIVAAIAAATAARAVAAPEPEPSSRWLARSRLHARRAGLSRGEWRMSGRIGRRARA